MSVPPRAATLATALAGASAVALFAAGCGLPGTPARPLAEAAVLAALAPARDTHPPPTPARTLPPAPPIPARPDEMASPAPEPRGGPAIAAWILVLSADGTEPVLGAIRQLLDFQGTPYDLWIAADRPGDLTPDRLSAGDRGFYQACILATGRLARSDGTAWASALSPAEWQALEAYEAAFGIRRLVLYAYPDASHGFNEPVPVDTRFQPVLARLTPAGSAVFPYLAPDAALPVQGVWAFLARPLDGATTPLLVDAAGNALAVVRSHPDGRETLALTCDGNAWSLHSLLLAHGALSWATRGLFLGERRISLAAQVDDLFLPTRLWGQAESQPFRLTGDDLRGVAAWQATVRARPTTGNFRLELAFNGGGIYSGDSLAAAAFDLSAEFAWVNHTFTHRNLDGATYWETLGELRDNHAAAAALRLANYGALGLVTPEVSGLGNPGAMAAAYDFGIRYLVSDASLAPGGAPGPNIGVPNAMAPGIFEIPRYPTGLFFDVSTPAEWEARYNDRYRTFWGRDLTAAEIVDLESDVLLRYLLRGQWNPLMFHQANLRDHGAGSLLGNLIDAVLAKYDRHMRLPVESLGLADLAGRFAARTALAAAAASASIRPGVSITLATQRTAIVPVTGLETLGAEYYGGRPIARVRVPAGMPLTLPLEPATP
ncbi:MAG: hypothetical protein FJZ01_18530 [Candidatus Sericytochromatia bacterium]|nr:hypothetical protein [Candidatus Tanganyikabacteria bacterium]